jgi:hypothetical protein
VEIVRWRDVKESLMGHPEYRSHVGIAIALVGDPVDGLPSKEEVAALDRLEAEISGSIESGNEALIVGSLTSQDRRGYVVYSCDPAGTERKLRELSKRSAPYELRFQISEDPQWRNYSKYFAM